MPRPRALCVAAMLPALSGNGLAMRTSLFVEALARVADTELLLLPIFGTGEESSPYVETLGVCVRVVPVAGRADTQAQLIGRVADPEERLRRFVAYGRGSRHAALSAAVLDDVNRTFGAARFDLVHCERLYLAEAAIAAGGLSLSVDLDEDDGAAWLSGAHGGEDARRWAQAEAAAEDRLLETVRPRVERLFISSPADLDSLRQRHAGLDAEVVDNGVTFPAAPARRDDGRTLLFVGAYGYAPNAEGIGWFVEKVWPALRDLDLRLVLVGPDMPDRLRALAAQPGIEVRGRVANLADAYAEASLAIAPLLSGGGTRTKLIEAAAHEVPIVATRRAAAGLDFLVDGAWLADGAEDFAAAVRGALASPAERTRRAGQARRAAMMRHDRARIISALAERFAQMLASPASY